MNQSPLFKYLDIVREKYNDKVYYIIDYNKKNDMYYYEDLKGHTYMKQSENIHTLFEKIGETTFDILKKSNANLKRKQCKYIMNAEEKILNNFLKCIEWIENNVINCIQVPCKITWKYDNNFLHTNTIVPYQLCNFNYNNETYYSDSDKVEQGYKILRDLPQYYMYSFILCWNDIKNQLITEISIQKNIIDNFKV